VLQFVSEFKYLGHSIIKDLYDNNDFQRGIRNMFIITNRAYSRMSIFKIFLRVRIAYFISFHDAALRILYSESSLRELSSCYNKCRKIFFNYSCRDNLTQILLQLGLPSFKTIIVNSSVVYSSCFVNCPNSINIILRVLGYCWYCLFDVLNDVRFVIVVYCLCVLFFPYSVLISCS